MKDDRYEIEKMFKECESLDFEFRNRILMLLDGIYQGMDNSVNNPRRYMKHNTIDEESDYFEIGHELVVATYKK